MAEYSWNAPLLRHVFVMPNAVADEHLRLAGAVQLKVLLWLSRNGGQYNDTACAQAIGASAADCRDALRYWTDAGVLLAEPSATAEPVLLPPAESEQKPPVPSVPAARPQAVKPQMPEVIARRDGCSKFAYLLDEVGARMGRPLSPGDMETLLYLFDTAGLPAEVILMVVGYAVSVGRLSMRYIEKVALDWADRGIVTMADAEDHLCRLERRQQALLRVQTLCALDKMPSGTVTGDLAEKWINDWKVADEVLCLAHSVCVKKTGKFQAKYIDRVLENWREQGADTAEKAAALCGTPSASAPTEAVSEYEEMIAQYIPVYKKKKKG